MITSFIIPFGNDFAAHLAMNSFLLTRFLENRINCTVKRETKCGALFIICLKDQLFSSNLPALNCKCAMRKIRSLAGRVSWWMILKKKHWFVLRNSEKRRVFSKSTLSQFVAAEYQCSRQSTSKKYHPCWGTVFACITSSNFYPWAT